MNGILKDDLTVALDEVDRIASRIVTIYQDLAVLAGDASLARRFGREAQLRRHGLARFNRARRAAGQTPEVSDPERAHLQSLWLALRATVAGGQSESRIDRLLTDLDRSLADTVSAALELCPEDDIAAALRALPGPTFSP